MTIDYREIINVVAELANDENIKVTLNQSVKGAAVCGVFSFLGGLLLGPRGLAIGGVAGSLLAYGMTNDTFRSLGDVIQNDLSESQKIMLAQRIKRAVEGVNITDFVMLLSFIQNDAGIKQAVLKEATNFVTNELSMQIID